MDGPKDGRNGRTEEMEGETEGGTEGDEDEGQTVATPSDANEQSNGNQTVGGTSENSNQTNGGSSESTRRYSINVSPP